MTKLDEVQQGLAQLLDVRTREEWDEGHADKAIHIPLDALLSGIPADLDTAKPVYIYCRSGARAYHAAQFLAQHGFLATSVGGLSDWQAAEA